MKSIKLILSAVCTVAMSGMIACDNKQQVNSLPGNTGPVYMHIDNRFEFIPVDAEDNDLLKTEQPLTLADFDIVLYDERNEPYYFYNPMLGDPKNIRVDDCVCVYLNSPKDEKTNTEITYLRILDEIHTVKAEWKITYAEPDAGSDVWGYSATVRKIWLDDELVADRENSMETPRIKIERVR